MDIKVMPKLLRGEVTPPSSKSQCHREIICAALAHGESRLKNIYFSDDITRSFKCSSFPRRAASIAC